MAEYLSDASVPSSLGFGPLRGIGQDPTATPTAPSTFDKILAITGQLTDYYAKLQVAKQQLKAARSGAEQSAASDQMTALQGRINQLETEKRAAEGKMPTWVLPVTIGVVGLGLFALIAALAMKKPRRRRRSR